MASLPANIAQQAQDWANQNPDVVQFIQQRLDLFKAGGGMVTLTRIGDVSDILIAQQELERLRSLKSWHRRDNLEHALEQYISHPDCRGLVRAYRGNDFLGAACIAWGFAIEGPDISVGHVGTTRDAEDRLIPKVKGAGTALLQEIAAHAEEKERRLSCGDVVTPEWTVPLGLKQYYGWTLAATYYVARM